MASWWDTVAGANFARGKRVRFAIESADGPQASRLASGRATGQARRVEDLVDDLHPSELARHTTPAALRDHVLRVLAEAEICDSAVAEARTDEELGSAPVHALFVYASDHDGASAYSVPEERVPEPVAKYLRPGHVCTALDFESFDDAVRAMTLQAPVAPHSPERFYASWQGELAMWRDHHAPPLEHFAPFVGAFREYAVPYPSPGFAPAKPGILDVRFARVVVITSR